jgi:4,5-DOPA dioxygenase extradiol
MFVGHGSPMVTLDDNEFTRGWRTMVAGIKPKAVLCISAHWCTNGTGVTAMSSPRTIHDFYGFPEALFQIQYNASGDPALAQRVQSLLTPTDVVLDEQWGLDHGSWSVLRHMFPQADVPVLQLSIDMGRDAQWHYDRGNALKPLRDEGVLIIGSGDVVHNLGQVDFMNQDRIFPWADQFNKHARQCIESRNHQPLINYQQGDASIVQAARLSIPTPDHYYPLMYVLGASDANDLVEISLDKIVMGSISMMSMKLG